MAEFIVKRAHWGDKDGKRHRYQPGEIREADPVDVAAHLHRKHLDLYLPQFDHDQDGAPGGSLPRRGRRRVSEGAVEA